MSFVTSSRKISIDVRTCGAVFGILLCSVATVWAGGTYQRTRDGKTLVWNGEPRPGDTPAWSGDRDRDGYASGFGTLTWYKAKAREGRDSKPTLYAYYFGNMVRGKFNGPVNGHSRGLTSYAMFIEGRRTSRWASGPTPSWKISQPEAPSLTESSDEIVIAKVRKIEPIEFTPPPPSYGRDGAERPAPDFSKLHEQSADVPAEGPAAVEKDKAGSTPANTPPHRPKLDIDDSLLALTGPPSSLEPRADVPGTKSNASTSAPGAGKLSKQKVIDLADAEARKRGYDIGAYQRLEPVFDPADQIWSLFYVRTPGENEKQTARHFTVAIDDKSRRTAIVPAR